MTNICENSDRHSPLPMPSSTSSVLLLVDGYNIIGAWRELAALRDRAALDTARYQLIEALINYSAIQGWQTELVFDAHAQKTPAYSEPQTPQLSVYYTAYAQTADTYIEKVCASFARLPYAAHRLIVATSDRAQQQTASGYGAEWKSAPQLVSEIERLSRRSRRHHQPPKASRGRFLVHSLDPRAQQRLAQLRRGVAPPTSKARPQTPTS